MDQNTRAIKGFQGISGSTLKIIAIVTMLIDHIGAAILEAHYLLPLGNRMFLSPYFSMDQALRSIGRISFPIFCFLLVEGYIHTSNVKKYLLRLFLFALISEIPFDLAFQGNPLELSHQNVFFTLFFGLVLIALFDWIPAKIEKHYMKVALQIFCIIGIALIADVLRFDYGAYGILAIFIFYLFRNQRMVACIINAIYFASWDGITAPISMLLIYFYNGKRGISLKYLFYAFYPVHLLLLYAVRIFLL